MRDCISQAIKLHQVAVSGDVNHFRKVRPSALPIFREWLNQPLIRIFFKLCHRNIRPRHKIWHSSAVYPHANLIICCRPIAGIGVNRHIEFVLYPLHHRIVCRIVASAGHEKAVVAGQRKINVLGVALCTCFSRFG